MGKQFNQLTGQERCLIWHYKALNYSLRSIGKTLNRDHRTIGKELKRNRNKEILTWQEKAKYAQDLSESRKSTANSHPKIKQSAKDYIREILKEIKPSPFLIAGKMCKEHREDSIGKDAIYRWIKKEAPELIKYLPAFGKKRKLIARKRKKIHYSTPKVSIHERPKELSTIGHLEGDTMHGIKGKSVLSVHMDRLTKLISLKKLSSTNSLEFKEASLNLEKDFYKVNSLTLDNGPECACYPELMKYFKVYFCNPFHSWEKGAIENRIQVLRLFIPKGFNIDLLSDQDILNIQNKVNSRPMACLNFNTPANYHKSFMPTLN